MPSIDNDQKDQSRGLQIPGLSQSQETVEQLPFRAYPITPSPEHPPVAYRAVPGQSHLSTKRQPLSQADPRTPAPENTNPAGLASQAKITRALTDPLSLSGTTAFRAPVVIRGANKEAGRLVRPPQGRRHVIAIAGLVLLVIIASGTLFAVSPLGREAGFSSFTVVSTLIPGGKSPDLNLVAQQATATAIIHQQNDGYDPNANGGPLVTGSPETWPLGVCTYWANLRYHELTGAWVMWRGNAYQWAQGAREAGWNVSSTPHVPSIIVLMPGVQGASSYGHVAVVESADGNTVHTSNMNWYSNGGGFNRVSHNDFTAGPGVSFIWK